MKGTYMNNKKILAALDLFIFIIQTFQKFQSLKKILAVL